VRSQSREIGHDASNPWISKFVFPGAYCPALSEVMPAIERSCLLTTDIELLWLHYADTLRYWQRRFAANRHTIASLYDERFCRMFEFYLSTANWVPTTAAWRSSKSSSRTSGPPCR
jgi:cyclopropane-fatty-acyl-phospholipid synthase